jgi:hypothetical protein
MERRTQGEASNQLIFPCFKLTRARDQGATGGAILDQA